MRYIRRPSALLAWVVCLVAAIAGPRAGAKEVAGKPHVGSAAPPLSPAEAQKKFKVPDGFEVRLFAAEPDVINPVAMSFDERGRLWVVELYEYPYEKPKGETRKGRDRVICLEDPDGTGHATRRTVVAEDLWLATAITWGNGGIYVGQTPDLYFYPITDTPDGPKAGARTTLLTGFGAEDKHELLNSFCWGPDGWLYFTHGVFTHSLVRDPGNPNDHGTKMDAAVARYHPWTKRFEVWCDGISNQWGVDWDAAGNAFVSACVVDHIWHVIPGGVYKRQGGQPNVPFTYELLNPINKDKHRHFMAAYGGVNVYQGSLFPPEYKGTVFMGNIHGNCLDHDRLTPDGSSFAATDMRAKADSGEWLEANDDWFRPVSEQTGPDGAIWIMDWYDKYPCYQNSQAPDLDREKGRIWRVVYVGTDAGKAVATHEQGMDLARASDGQLVELLANPNIWQRRVAQRLLNERVRANRAGDDLAAALANTTKSGATFDARMAGLWALGATGLIDDGMLDAAAGDKEPAVRAWAARLTGERGAGSAADLARLKRLAADAEPSVLAGVAEAARRLRDADTLPVITVLAKQPAIAGDPQLPFLLWMATEPKVVGRAAPRAARLGPDAVDALVELGEPAPGNVLGTLAAEAGNAPATADLARRIVHRLIDANDPRALAGVASLANTLGADQAAAARGILQGMLDAQKKGAPRPAGTEALDLARLQASPDKTLAAAAAQLSALWGNATAAAASLKAVNDPAAPVEERMKAIRLAVQLDSDPARAALAQLVKDKGPDALRVEAIRAIGSIGDDGAAAVILGAWGTLPPPSRGVAVEVLTTRAAWAKALLTAVKNKAVAADDLSATALRNMARSKDKEVQQLLATAVGRVRESDPDKVSLVAAKKHVAMNGPVDLEAGHAIMRKTCLVCHTFYGEGAAVGPDLTGVGRSTLDALLTNVIDPNQIIGAGYENTIVETKDNRSFSGRLVESTEDHVKLLSAGPKEETVARSEIATMRTEKISVMPEGLVDTMPDADLRNLIWYVYSPRQDDKQHKLRIDLTDKRLTVKAKLPGSEEMVDLLAYATDPAARPSLDPLRDPTGTLVMTAAGKPSISPGQSRGVFTGLREVGPGKLDFWAEGGARFVAVTDLSEANDRVGWKATANWVGPDGKVVLEEEQAVTVYAVDSPDVYRVDLDWTLRAPGAAAVPIGAADYGGLAVRLDATTVHAHLNSAGETGAAATANCEAQWCDVTIPLGDRMAGIAVLDHPANAGSPARWRVDGQGTVNPSPSLKGSWSVEPGKPRTFRYRLVVHAGAADLAKLRAEFNAFVATGAEGK